MHILYHKVQVLSTPDLFKVFGMCSPTLNERHRSLSSRRVTQPHYLNRELPSLVVIAYDFILILVIEERVPNLQSVNTRSMKIAIYYSSVHGGKNNRKFQLYLVALAVSSPTGFNGQSHIFKSFLERLQSLLGKKFGFLAS
jgi:hypothetical protein